MNRITPNQLFMFMVIFFYSTPAGFLIGSLTATSSYDAGLALCIAAACGLFLGLIALYAAKQRPDQFVSEYGHEWIGRWLHIPLMLLIVVYLVLGAAITLRQLEDFIVQNHLPGTPGWIIAILIGVCCAFAVRAGVGAIFRLGQVLFIVSLLVLLIFTPISFGINTHTPMIMAFIKNHEWNRIITGIYQSISWFGDLFIVFFLYPYFQKPMLAGRALLWASVLGTAFVLAYTIPTIMAFGPQLTGNLSYPILEYVRSLRIADFIETMDPFMTIIWIPVIMIKMSLFLYVATHTLAKVLSIANYKPLSYSITATMIGLSKQIADNAIQLQYWVQYAWPLYGIIIQCVPIIYLAGSLVKGSGAKKQAQLESSQTR